MSPVCTPLGGGRVSQGSESALKRIIMEEKDHEIAAALPNVGLLVELGPQRRKQIRQLKRGEGALAYRIQAAVEQRREELGIDAAAEIVPVVLLYRESEPDYVVITPRREDR